MDSLPAVSSPPLTYSSVLALSALLASNAAESLVLGTRGPSGIAWAATSIVGLVWVVRACISGSCSGWLRESLGVRTRTSDGAIGMDLSGASTGAARVRKGMKQALGSARDKKRGDSRDVYAFDDAQSSLLATIPKSSPGSMRVFTYADYANQRNRDFRFQILSLVLLVFIQVAQFLIMKNMEDMLLTLITMLPSIYFSMIAVGMQLYEYLGPPHDIDEGALDIVSGTLPTALQPGGSRKIVLGIATNPRTSFWWRLMWGLGALVSSSSLGFSYILLGHQKSSTVYIWASFQLFFVTARLIILKFANHKDVNAYRSVTECLWDSAHLSQKQRVLNLTLDVARYQTQLHPRGELSYADDTFSPSDISELTRTPLKPYYPLPNPKPDADSTMNVSIKSIIGDTVLSSATWITGSTLTSLDLYDSCLITFTTPSLSLHNSDDSNNKHICVPAARVLCGIPSTGPPLKTDTFSPQFPPRGVPNPGFGISWWYYIPAGPNTWLLVKKDVGPPVVARSQARTAILGTVTAEVLSDAQVASQLAAGDLNIAISRVDELRGVVDLAREARLAVLRLIQ